MRTTRKTRHQLLRVLIVIAFAAFWMGVPKPPTPGCRGPRPPLPLHEAPAPSLPR